MSLRGWRKILLHDDSFASVKIDIDANQFLCSSKPDFLVGCPSIQLGESVLRLRIQRSEKPYILSHVAISNYG